MTNKGDKEFLRSQVIKESFRGKTRQEIAAHSSTSTGNVSHILMDFKKKVGESAVDETIEFARMVRKSGITMDQCLEGFRMYMLMDRLGFNTDNDSNDKNKEFQDFVNQICFPCKDMGIHPSWIFEWIKDLLSLTVKLKNIPPTDSIYNDSTPEKQDANPLVNSLNTYPEQYTNKSKIEEDSNQQPLINCNSTADANLSGTDETEHPFPFTYCKLPNSSASNVHGLLLSDVVNLISQVQNNG